MQPGAACVVSFLQTWRLRREEQRPVEQFSSFIPTATAFGFRRERWAGMLLQWVVGGLPSVGSRCRSLEWCELFDLLSSPELPAGALGLCHLLLVPSSSTALPQSAHHSGGVEHFWGSQSSHEKCNHHRARVVPLVQDEAPKSAVGSTALEP